MMWDVMIMIFISLKQNIYVVYENLLNVVVVLFFIILYSKQDKECTMLNRMYTEFLIEDNW